MNTNELIAKVRQLPGSESLPLRFELTPNAASMLSTYGAAVLDIDTISKVTIEEAGCAPQTCIDVLLYFKS